MEAEEGGSLSYLLDTNVVSQTAKKQVNSAVMHWWHRCNASELLISVVVLQELRYGIELVPDGKRRRELEDLLERSVVPGFAGRVLPVNEAIADLGGRLLAAAKISAHTAEVGDALVAATAKVHGLRVATLNRRHFERLGVELVEF